VSALVALVLWLELICVEGEIIKVADAAAVSLGSRVEAEIAGLERP
jgi:hypothetical protein